MNKTIYPDTVLSYHEWLINLRVEHIAARFRIAGHIFGRALVDLETLIQETK